MDKKRKRVLFQGVFCVLLAVLASCYSIAFNEARLVVPTDFSTYVFRVQDLPMILSLLLLFLYILRLCVWLIRSSSAKIRGRESPQFTRSLNPKLGFLGIFGCLGFLGFWSYPQYQNVTPFLFFLFFGFFGFFYEGKLSHTLIDERFQENQFRAQYTAMKLGITILFLAAVILGQGKLLGSLEYSFIALLIVLALVMGLVLFLSEYLLYRYDHEDSGE